MVPGDLTDPLRDFIHTYIDSVDALEILLLLHRDRQKTWNLAEITTELRTSELAARTELERLCALGLLVCDDQLRYRFQPTRHELESRAEELAEAFRYRKTAVIALIYSKPPDSLRAFADAFRLKKDNKGDD